MEPVFREVIAPNDLNIVPVSPRFAAAIKQTDKAEWKNFFNFIRLNLQSRINGQETPDEIRKLQGKIEFIQEINSFIDRIIEKTG